MGLFSDFGQLSDMTTRFFAAGVVLRVDPMTCTSDGLALHCLMTDEISMTTVHDCS